MRARICAWVIIAYLLAMAAVAEEGERLRRERPSDDEGDE